LQYRAPLMNQGFTEMATLFDMTEEDMRDIGLLSGHAKKLHRQLREYREARGDKSQDGEEQKATMCRSVSANSTVVSSLHGGAFSKRVEPICSISTPSSPSLCSSLGESIRFDLKPDMRMAVEKSWEKVQAVGTINVANLLMKYTRELDSEALQLYASRAEPKEGETEDDVVRKLMARTLHILGSSVAGLSDTATLVRHLDKVGAGLAGSGIKEGYFTVVGKAFQLSLQDILGDRFTAEIATVWKIEYDFMASIMIAGLRSFEDAQ